MLTDQVVFAEDEVTIHVLIGAAPASKNKKQKPPTISKTLLPGQTIEPSELPWYLIEAIENQTAHGLRLMTPVEVEARLAERERFLSTQSPSTNVASS